MEKIETISELKSAIQQLEIEQSTQLILLKEEFYTICERLKPINIIRDTWEESNLISELKTKAVNSILGVSSGLIAKKLILGKTNNPITKMLGLLIEIFVSKTIVKHADEIKSFSG
jgi:hypothetical protein